MPDSQREPEGRMGKDHRLAVKLKNDEDLWMVDDQIRPEDLMPRRLDER